MANKQKYTRGAMGHMLAHYDRTKHIDNVDLSRTHLNYNLAPNREGMSQLDYVHQRLSEVKVQNRADVNVLVDWVVTMPKKFNVLYSNVFDKDEVERKFFEKTYEFLVNRYGGEKNVISAFVHKDEVTPHLHFAFLPICENKSKSKNKKFAEKLCAKEVITLQDLKTFHIDLQNHLCKTLGIDFEVLNEATKEGNQSIAELKRTSAVEEMAIVNELKAEQEQIEKEISDYSADTPQKRLFESNSAYDDRVQHQKQVIFIKKKTDELDEKENKLKKKEKELKDREHQIYLNELKISNEKDKYYQKGYERGYNEGRTNGIAYANEITLQKENEQISALKSQIDLFEEIKTLIDTNPEFNEAYQRALAEQEEKKKQRQKNRGKELC